MQEIKKCPMCGGKPHVRKISKHGNGGCDLYTWCVECWTCRLSTDNFTDYAARDDDGIRLTVDGRQEAIAAWNKRVEP